jgi:hypothetical protein
MVMEVRVVLILMAAMRTQLLIGGLILAKILKVNRMMIA